MIGLPGNAVDALESRCMLSAVAGDGFESGNFDGGSDQWASDGGWTASGDAVVLSGGQNSGTYHARLRRSTGDLQRTVDVSNLTDVQLQFSSRLYSFEGSDQAHVQVSGDGVNWTTLQTFVNGQDDNLYHDYTLNVPDLGDNLHIRFDAAMSGSGDYWYVDDVQITGEPAVTLPSLTIDDVQLAEGDSGTTAMIFTVTRSGDTSGTSSVDFTTIDGTATAGDDYVSTNGTLQFLADEVTKTISVQVNGDTDIEPSEAFTVELSNPTDAVIADGQGTGAIVDDDVTSTISYPDFSDPTGLTLVGNAVIADGNVLRLTPALGSQEGAAWYSGEKQFVSTAWETTFDFNLNENQDSPGGSDGFVFAIQNHDPSFLQGGGGPLGYFNLPNSLVVEFDTFQNSEAGDPSQSHISVHTNGTGPNGWSESLSLGSYNTPTIMDDAQTHTARIHYTPGQLSIYLDDLTTPVLTVDVNLAQTLQLDGGRAWVGFTATTGGGWQNHDILNWDYRVLEDTSTTVAINDASVVEENAGTADLVFTVTRAGDTSGTMMLDWTTANGTAIAGDDYVAASGQLTFVPGETAQTITVSINGDAVEETAETLSVVLSNASGGLLVTQAGTGTILNDDVSISISDATVIEGDTSIRFTDAFVAATAGGLSRPTGMVFGPDGNLYVASVGTDSIHRYDAQTGAFLGEFVTSGLGGLQSPRGIAFHNGDLFVASALTDAVLRYDGTSGAFLGEFVAAGSGGLDEPRGLLFGSNNDLYVTSAGDGDQVLRYDATTGTFIDVFIASGNGLNNPTAVKIGPDGNFYVASTAATSNAVLRYDASGAFVDTFIPGGTGGLDGPTDLLFTSGLLLVSGARSDAVLAYNPVTGQYVGDYVAAGLGGLDNPNAILLDADGHLYVSSVNSDEVLRYASSSVAVVTVSLSAPSGSIVFVDFTTSDGTAVAVDGDYLTASGTIVFDPGVTERTILMKTLDDSDIESDETFFVDLYNPTGAAIADTQGEVTIVDNDLPVETVLFEDSFEVGTWNGLWVEDSQDDWFRSSQRATDGNVSAEIDGSASNATLTTASSFDLSGYSSATLKYSWYIESGFDFGEFLALDISLDGGNTWLNDVRRLNGNQDQENVWHHETIDMTPYLSASTRFRFRSSVSSSSEDANVDNVRLVASGNAATTSAVAFASALIDEGNDDMETSIFSGRQRPV